MATSRRQNPIESQGARTPMNGEPRTDLIQLITRTESLSGNGDLGPARPTLIRRHNATPKKLPSKHLSGLSIEQGKPQSIRALT